MTRICVDWDACIGSGMCTSQAPELFDLDDEGNLVLLQGEEVAPEHAESVRAAADVCPVEAITVETRR